MKKYFVLFILVYSFLPIYYSLGATTSTGFIPGQIWYSKDQLVEGDTVKIYTALFNNSDSALSAKVEFYDKNVILGSRDVIVAASSLKEASVSWKITSGEHSISAKIISPSITTGGKKVTVAIENSLTEVDRKFVPVVLTTVDGKSATSSDVIKSQMDKATLTLDGILPTSISTPVSENINSVDSFRANTLDKIINTKVETEKKLDELKSIDSKVPATNTSTKNTTNTQVNQPKAGISDATEKPITYLKLIFFSILSFIFGSKFVFYLLILFVMFLILRFIYLRIRKKY